MAEQTIPGINFPDNGRRVYSESWQYEQEQIGLAIQSRINDIITSGIQTGGDVVVSGAGTVTVGATLAYDTQNRRVVVSSPHTFSFDSSGEFTLVLRHAWDSSPGNDADMQGTIVEHRADGFEILARSGEVDPDDIELRIVTYTAGSLILGEDRRKYREFVKEIRGVWKTGDIKESYDPDGEPGWGMFNGQSIGDAYSNASQRAARDTYDLFVLLFSKFSDAQHPLQTSSGTATTRAAFSNDPDSAWVAHCNIELPDVRGRVTIGRDNMGGTAANRITLAGSGIDGTKIGATGGVEFRVLTIGNLPPHDHDTTVSAYIHSHDGFTGYMDQNVSHGHGMIRENDFSQDPHGHNSQSNWGFPVPGAISSSLDWFVRNDSIEAANIDHRHPISADTHGHTVDVSTTGNGDPVGLVQPCIVVNKLIKF